MVANFKICPKIYSLFMFLACFVLFSVFYLVAYTSHIKTTFLIEQNQSAYNEFFDSPSWLIKENGWRYKQEPLSPRADCQRIINGDKREISRAKKIMKHHQKKVITSQDFLNLTKNCDTFKKDRGYIMRALRKREKEFPIAFGMSIYVDIEQFERLLRAIYRPQNYYCIHVDKKTPEIFHRAVQGISKCFPNVFIASALVDVRWGEFTILRSYLNCLTDLWRRFKNWKYFINLTGQEFPLKTNNELVKILKSFNGKSLVSSYKPKTRRTQKRYQYVYEGRKVTKKMKTPFRLNFTFFKGSTYVALSHSFANFSLNSHVAKEFLEWVKDTGIPDETFLQTLYRNSKFPSPSPAAMKPRKPLISHTRYVNWGSKPCHGKMVRQVCINGVGDIHSFIGRPELFVNKFHLAYEYLALDCMEEWFYNKTLAYYQGKLKTSTALGKKRK